MKPTCRLCQEEDQNPILNDNLNQDLVAGLFNPSAVIPQGETNDENKSGSNQSNEPQLEAGSSGDLKGLKDYLDYRMKINAGLYVNMPSDQPQNNTGNKNSQNIREHLGELLEEVSKNPSANKKLVAEMMMNHYEGIVQELSKEGLVEPSDPMEPPVFTPKGEKMIAERVLEDAFLDLRRKGIGPHETKEGGFGTYPSELLAEYDASQNDYDMVDIQETLLNVALKDPENMKISEDDIKIRVPLHKARASNVILIDKSGSMRWRYKILGAISAALGLRELLDSYYSEDQLWIVGYDQEPSVLGPGEIVNLRSYGWTDIGRALDFARGILKGEENNRNIFLLTDSEPTVSTEHQQSPLESALRAARLLGLDEIKLNIIMLDESPQLRMISSQMAALCGQASIAYVSDPLNLRDFVLESYIKGRA